MHLAILEKQKSKMDKKFWIYDATGAIGTAAVQLAKYHGAKVIAVCNTQNVELVKSLGADKVIDYIKEDFTESGEDYNFVFDAVGKSSFGVCKKLIKPGGIYKKPIRISAALAAG